jgi:TolA-binding protein
MQLLIEKHPDTSWARYAKERLQEQGVITSGLELKINSSNLNEYMGRAITYFNQEKLDEAKSILLQISERFPDFEGAPQALAALALCYYKDGDFPNTIKYYQKLVDRYPEHPLMTEAYFHLGLSQERLGNKILAENAFRKVLALDPGGVYGKQAKTKVGR